MCIENLHFAFCSVYLFLLDQGALLAEKIHGDSGSGDAGKLGGVKIDGLARVQRDQNNKKTSKKLHGGEHVEDRTQKPSAGAGRVGGRVAPHQPKSSSLSKTREGLTSPPRNETKKEFSRGYPQSPVLDPGVPFGKEAVLTKRKPASPPSRGVYGRRRPKATESVDDLAQNAQSLAPVRLQTDARIHDADDVLLAAGKLPSGTFNRLSGGHWHADSLVHSKRTPVAEVTVKALASHPDDWRREPVEGESSSAVNSPPVAFSRPAGGSQQSDSMGHTQGSPVAKSTGRLSSFRYEDVSPKVSRFQASAEKEDTAHTDSGITLPQHEGCRKDAKIASPSQVLMQAYDRTATKSDPKDTLPKRFCSIASSAFARRPPKSAISVPDGHSKQAETSKETGSQGSRGHSFAEAKGPHMPPDRGEITSKPIGLFTQLKTQVGQLASTDGAAEKSKTAGSRQSSMEAEEQTPVGRD